MKKLLLMLFCCILSVAAWSQQSRPPRVVSINGTYTNTQTLQPFLGSHNLHALAISGSVTLNSDTSLVRVIMHDVDGKSYLMYEASPMLINGYTETFTDANEETEWMCGVVPQDLKIVVKDATCTVTGLTATQYSADNHPLRAPAQRDSIRIRQVQAKVDKINAYNAAHSLFWRAGINPLALQEYQLKREWLFDEDNGNSFGLEYYTNGVFEVGPANMSYPTTINDCYTEEFSWNSRHSQNWVTNVKNQNSIDLEGKPMDTGYCWAFATIGQLEAYYNLYYNRHIDLDLSEEDVAMHSGCRNYRGGAYSGYIDGVATYFLEKGATFEDSVPLHIGPYRENPFNPNYPRFKISGYQNLFPNVKVDNNDITQIKRAIIANGPMASCICGHAMLLVGYKKLKEGDIILYEHNGTHDDTVRITRNDPRIGQVCWIYKNSYGTDDIYSTGGNGYMHVVYKSYSYMDTPAVYEFPPTISNIELLPSSVADSLSVKVIDRDGDGYYCWGLGPKPSNMPSWIPDEPDGDDSDYTKGPMDEHGVIRENLLDENNIIYLKNDTTIEGFKYLHTPIIVQNGSSVTIKGTILGCDGMTISLSEDSHLVFDEGELSNIKIIGTGSSNIAIQNNSRLNISHSQKNVLTLQRTQ